MPAIAVNARQQLRIVMLTLAIFGATGWYFFAILFWQTPGQDLMVFHTAAHVMARGDIALLLDGARFTAELNRTHADWLRANIVFHPWVYPPPMLLIAMPLGLLSYGAAYLVFTGGTLAAMIATLILWARDAQSRALLIGGVIVCPATAYAIGAGQNSFLNATLILAGFFLLPTRPFVAGLLLGVLGLKPQLALMVPVALLAGRHWRAIFGVATSGVLLGLLSLPIGGLALWQAWLTLMLSGDAAFHTWIEAGRMYGQSVYADARVLGATHGIATAAQWAAAGISATAVWHAFSRAYPNTLRLSVFLVATILAAPHVAPYDAVFVGIAAMLTLLNGLTRPFAKHEAMAAMLLWLTTLINPAFLLPPGVITPLVFAFYLFTVLRPTAGAQT